MRCYELFHVREDRTGPRPGLAWRPVPDLGSPSDRFAEGLKRRTGAGR